MSSPALRFLIFTVARWASRGNYLIHDRDPLYTTDLHAILESGGVTPVRLPPKSPNLDAHAERFVRSTKEGRLAHIVPPGERHLRAVDSDFVAHDHQERNHQGLGNQPIAPRLASRRNTGLVLRRERDGGILNDYHREAA